MGDKIAKPLSNEELVAKVATLTAEIAVKDNEIAELTKSAKEKDETISDLMTAVAEADAAPKATVNTIKIDGVNYTLLIPKCHLKVASSAIPVLATIETISKSEEQQQSAIKAGILVTSKPNS